MKSKIYLDAAATTKPKKEVVDAMMPYFTDLWHNPSSLYAPSIEIKRKVEESRKIVAEFIGADSNEIFFTSGGSESNCWAIKGFAEECFEKFITPIIITSSIEHKSILDCANKSICGDIYIVGVDESGRLNIEELKNLLINLHAQNESDIINCKILVSIQFANNEIGTIQYIEQISELVHKYDGIFHTDAVQAFGKTPINVEKLGIDMLSASGHKIGTPKGIGFLYKKSDIKIKPLIYGTQMDGMRGGTENVPYIIGLSKAVEMAQKYMDIYLNFGDWTKENLQQYFIRELKNIGCKLNGTDGYRLKDNINVTFSQNITGEALLYTLDLSGIQISTGSACNSSSIEPSHVLKAIGLSDEDAMKTVRFTLADDTTYEDIDYVIEEIDKAIKLISLEGNGEH